MTIYLIRHGEAAQAWDEAPDPALSKTGKEQAVKLAEEYLPIVKNKNFQLMSSPLLRAQQTALPFKESMGLAPIINQKIAEIPSPGIALKDRRDWLKALFTKRIKELEQPQLDWRNNIIQSISNLEKNTLIFSHFMTINAVVGWIKGDDRVVNYYPNYCSITKIVKKNCQYTIESLGNELTTIIQ